RGVGRVGTSLSILCMSILSHGPTSSPAMRPRTPTSCRARVPRGRREGGIPMGFPWRGVLPSSSDSLLPLFSSSLRRPPLSSASTHCMRPSLPSQSSQ
ncbi:hypothetical protein PMAYCL1PPCAC_25048, partial [Pristionchus mayeri]